MTLSPLGCPILPDKAGSLTPRTSYSQEIPQNSTPYLLPAILTILQSTLPGFSRQWGKSLPVFYHYRKVGALNSFFMAILLETLYKIKDILEKRFSDE